MDFSAASVAKSDKSVIADFDGVMYTITKEGDILTVSILLKFYNEIKEFGDSSVLSREFGDLLMPQPESGQSVSLRVNCKQLPADLDALATKCALLRRHCFASVFEHCFDCQSKGKELQGTINFRGDETM